MAAASKLPKIEELIAKAEASLQGESWFEAERLANRALAMARQETAFDLMIRAIAPLHESRMKRVAQALGRGGKVTVVDDAVPEDMKVRRGCYLVQPPLVGSDARRLRLIALANDVPVLVLCREPITRLNLMPVVAIGPGSTLRVRIQPPERPEAPDREWMIQALNDLGGWAIASMDMTMPVIRRIDLLLEYLDSLPEHDSLHHTLAAACREAQHEREAEAAGTKSAKSRMKS